MFLNMHCGSVAIALISLVPFAQAEKTNPAYLRPFAPYYSQSGQDKFLQERVFKGKRGGTFIDIGAHDGISYSNTYFFEKVLGWTGVCVEPQKKNFDALKENRKCVCLNGCVFTSDGEADFLQVNGPSEMLSGLLTTYSEKQLARAQREVAALGGSLEVYKVTIFSFNAICRANGLKHIDLLNIDTEGSEEAILRSIDFDQVEIDVIIAENNDYDLENPAFVDKITNFLGTKGYKLIAHLDADGIYRRQSR